MRYASVQAVASLGILSCLLSAAVGIEKPAEELFPATTRGFFAIPNVQRMEQAFDRIALGELVADPAVKPFLDDLQLQVESRLDRTGVRIGLSVEDLVDICAGEVAIAFIEPEDRNQKHAVAVLADVTGNKEAVDNLLKRVRASMKERNAERAEKVVDGINLEIFTVPIKKSSRKTFRAVIFQVGDRLVAADHEGVAMELLKTLQGKSDAPVLADQPQYQKTMQRVVKEAGNDEPHLKWFVEPLPYAIVTREAAALQKRSSRDVLDAIANQGFDVLQGAGGFLYFDQGDFDLLHYGYVYAPPVEGAPDRFTLAARVLAFPGASTLEVQPWIPAGVNSYVTGTWDLRRSYSYVGSLVDEVAGEPGFFDDLIESLEQDPAGPQINLQTEIVDHLGDRFTLITDCQLPVNPDSERFLIAISLSNPSAMEKGITKLLDTDPDAKPVEVDGHQFWEIINEEDMEAAVSAVNAEDGFASFGGFESDGDDQEMAEEEELALMSNSAISLVDDQLMIASHVDYIVEIMRKDPAVPGLGNCADYLTVEKALTKMGARPDDTVRLFSRADEEFQATYELIRQGKMPESKGLLGQVLNQVLGPKEKGVVREQQIDGTQMPEYDVVRQYLGTVGTFVRTEDKGWYGVAVGLAPKTPDDPHIDANLTTAGRESIDEGDKQ